MNNRMAWTFAITSIALFMVTLDNLVVTTAVPVIRTRLHASLSSLGDGVDRRGHDLRPPGGLHEGPLRARAVCQWAVPAPAPASPGGRTPSFARGQPVAAP